MQKKSLVTGGAGFIGAHVVNSLIAQQHQVVVLDDLSGGKKENIPTGATFVEGSITNQTLINDLFKIHQFDYVYHLAAYAAEGLSHFIRHFNYQNNVLGSMNLINAAINHKVKCFVFTSSIAVYGGGNPPFSENDTPQPEDPYGIAKYTVELDLKAAAEQFGLNYIIFRPHNVYGIYQNIGDPYRNVIGIFMNAIMQDKPLTIFGDGEQTRAFSYVEDVAPYIAQSVNDPKFYNQIYNIGATKSYSVNQLAQTVKEAFNSCVEINYQPKRNEVKHAFASHKKFEHDFNPAEYTELPTGIAKMAKWAKERGIEHAEPFQNIEITKKLPPSWAKLSKHEK